MCLFQLFSLHTSSPLNPSCSASVRGIVIPTVAVVKIMSLRLGVNAIRNLRTISRDPNLRHLSTATGTKDKKKTRSDVYEFNKQSLIVYGPILSSKPRKRNYKPVHYKDVSSNSENFEFLQCDDENDANLLPVLSVDVGNDSEVLDLNELLAQPLVPGEGVDPEICRFHGDRLHRTFKLRKMPSVTAILDRTMPSKNRELLEKWKKEQIELLGEEGFNLMQKETLATGHEFHACVHDFLTGQPESSLAMTSQVREGLWASVRQVLDDVTDVRFLEERVAHRGLLYSGIVDCVAEFNGTLCVIDWKTSKKRKQSLRQAYDNPIQVAAYTGAINFTREMKLRQGALVYAYPDGTPADVILVPTHRLNEYWALWLQRLQAYWKMALDEQETGRK